MEGVPLFAPSSKKKTKIWMSRVVPVFFSFISLLSYDGKSFRFFNDGTIMNHDIRRGGFWHDFLQPLREQQFQRPGALARVMSMVVSGSHKRWDRWHIAPQLAGFLPLIYHL